jgi:hypothetical protein
MGSFRGHKIVIKSPKLGILNLKGASASDDIATDRSAISTFFHVVEESEVAVPECDVLFVYCDFTADGAIAGSEAGIREMIRDSGAMVVVVASDNSADHYIASGRQRPPYGTANLAMTIDRRGPAFPTFYARLFDYMSQGVTMPMAWVKIAPQIPGRDHLDCPGAICALERGHVTFGSPIGFNG